MARGRRFEPTSLVRQRDRPSSRYTPQCVSRVKSDGENATCHQTVFDFVLSVLTNRKLMKHSNPNRPAGREPSSV